MAYKKQFSRDDAMQIGNRLGINWGKIEIDQFCAGLNVELEHGLVDERTNISNDNDIITAKIAWAHLNEISDYYSHLEHMEEQAKRGVVSVEHYYGDWIRKLFLTAAALMVVGLPFIYSYISLPVASSIVAALVLTIFAALTSPKNKWVIELNAGVAALAFLVFEFYSISFYNQQQPYLFFVNEVLAVLFLVALYYSVKTWRGRFGKM